MAILSADGRVMQPVRVVAQGTLKGLHGEPVRAVRNVAGWIASKAYGVTDETGILHSGGLPIGSVDLWDGTDVLTPDGRVIESVAFFDLATGVAADPVTGGVPRMGMNPGGINAAVRTGARHLVNLASYSPWEVSTGGYAALGEVNQDGTFATTVLGRIYTRRLIVPENAGDRVWITWEGGSSGGATIDTTGLTNLSAASAAANAGTTGLRGDYPQADPMGTLASVRVTITNAANFNADPIRNLHVAECEAGASGPLLLPKATIWHPRWLTDMSRYYGLRHLDTFNCNGQSWRPQKAGDLFFDWADRRTGSNGGTAYPNRRAAALVGSGANGSLSFKTPDYVKQSFQLGERLRVRGRDKHPFGANANNLRVRINAPSGGGSVTWFDDWSLDITPALGDASANSVRALINGSSPNYTEAFMCFDVWANNSQDPALSGDGTADVTPTGGWVTLTGGAFGKQGEKTPLEDILAVHDATQSPAWLPLPLTGSVDYYAGAASFIKTQRPKASYPYLYPLYPEVGNENWQFTSSDYGGRATMVANERALGNVSTDASVLHLDGWARMHIERMQAFEAEFTPGVDMVRVLGGQYANVTVAQALLSRPNVAAHTDVIAIAPYIGGYDPDMEVALTTTIRQQMEVGYGRIQAHHDAMLAAGKVDNQWHGLVALYEVNFDFIQNGADETYMDAIGADPRLGMLLLEFFAECFRRWPKMVQMGFLETGSAFGYRKHFRDTTINQRQIAIEHALAGEFPTYFPTYLGPSASPVITGARLVGSTLTCSEPPAYYETAPRQRQWLRDGAEIPGATGITYDQVAGDSGKTISRRTRLTGFFGTVDYFTTGDTVTETPVVLDADAEIYFARMSARPSVARQQVVSDMVTALKATNGGWSKIIGIYGASPVAEDDAQLNLKQVAYDLIEVGDMTYVQDDGFTGTGGATTRYFRTGFVPGVDPGLGQNDVMLCVWSNTATLSGSWFEAGTEITSGGLGLNTGTDSATPNATVRGRLFSAANVNFNVRTPAQGAASGGIMLSRTNSTQISSYTIEAGSGTQAGTTTASASVAPAASQEIRFGAAAVANGSGRQCPLYIFGAGVTPTEAANILAAVRTCVLALQAL